MQLNNSDTAVVGLIGCDKQHRKGGKSDTVSESQQDRKGLAVCGIALSPYAACK